MRYNLQTSFYDDFCSILHSEKKPYTASVSRNRREIIIGKDVYIFSDSEIPPSSLNFIKQTKKQIISAGEKIGKIIHPEDVQFYKVAAYNNYKRVTKDVVEIDISKAYWTAAYKLGYVDNSLFKKGLEVDKLSRLVAVGAAAVTKWHISFDGEQFDGIKEDFNPFGRSAFFHICKEVSRVMTLAAGDFAHLFWVDAIFCSAKDAPFVCQVFDSEGYEYKYKNIIWAKYESSETGLKLSYLEALKETQKVCEVRIKTFTFTHKKDKSFVKRAKKAHFENIKKTIS